ncbi:MAG: CopG family transcriptional regulator [Rhizobiales bacterium 65-79]|nr:CopG family transcriptional regulator [Hyphomicrobiales bacterium]OJU04837.1 MAG: CopG family transcriptional regulator [Rhizobiales bacterium 65-79]
MKLTYRLAALAALIATPLPAFAATINAVMYKNPSCSCCESYAAYLEQNGFKVDIKPVNNLSQISGDAGVPADLEGCHTLMVDGYVVDGLVPVDVVRKLLTERPAITGITLADMPTGAPGMGGEKTGTWTIYAFTKDGKAPTVYATE